MYLSPQHTDISNLLIGEDTSSDDDSATANEASSQKNTPAITNTIITFFIRSSIAVYVSMTLYRLLHEGQNQYFIYDEQELTAGYKQLEELSFRAVCVNITVYLAAIPEHGLRLLGSISSYCSKKPSSVDTIHNPETSKRLRHQNNNNKKQVVELKMVALMFIYSICAPIILSLLNKEDTFYPVSLTKEYSPTTLVTSNRINWLQFYRWGSLKPTASAYNMAYPATILWMIMLLSKSVMDCSITATEQYINLTELLKRRFIVSLLNAYQQSMGVTYLSIIPLFSFWLLTKVSHGSLLSYYWVMDDEKFRKDNAGNFKQLCSQEDETINWPADEIFFNRNNSFSNYTIEFTETASIYSYNCLPSLMGDVTIKAPWEFIVFNLNRQVATCNGDFFTPWEICNLPSKLPLLEFFILYPIGISLFILFAVSSRCCKNEKRSFEENISQILKQTTNDVYSWIESWHFFTIIILALIYIFLSNNFGASPAINGALELIGIKHENSRQDFGKLIISFINAWTGSIIIIGGVASHSAYHQVKTHLKSPCQLFSKTNSPPQRGAELIIENNRDSYQAP